MYVYHFTKDSFASFPSIELNFFPDKYWKENFDAVSISTKMLMAKLDGNVENKNYAITTETNTNLSWNTLHNLF